VAGLNAYGYWGPYVAARHGVVGIMRTAAIELGPLSIRVNTVNPSNVHTALMHNPTTYALVAPGVENPTWEQVAPSFRGLHRVGPASPGHGCS
jgi:(+)-trans-carveol dehydrogenase